MTPEQVIDLQLKYYDARDLKGFLSTYSPEIIIYKHGDNNPWMTGHDGLRDVYSKMFMRTGLHANIIKRMTLGNFVIDQEEVTWDNQDEILHAIATYEVRDDLIQRVWMVKTE